MVGGTTYEEAKAVAGFNEANPNMRVVLGGTTVHNFESFCDEIRLSAGGVGTYHHANLSHHTSIPFTQCTVQHHTHTLLIQRFPLAGRSTRK